jgi:hypothetical protein
VVTSRPTPPDSALRVDGQITAIAAANDATVVTANLADFHLLPSMTRETGPAFRRGFVFFGAIGDGVTTFCDVASSREVENNLRSENSSRVGVS